MAGHDIIVIGASAGGVEPLARLMGDLPRDLTASVCVVLHMGTHGNTALPQILARRSDLPVDPAVDGAEIEPGRIYVAVPDRHLFLEPGVVRVVTGARENGHRPSIDGLFRTAAAYGPRWSAWSCRGGAALCRRLADRAKTRRARLTADRFGTESVELQRQAAVLRAFLAAWPPQNAQESGLPSDE